MQPSPTAIERSLKEALALNNGSAYAGQYVHRSIVDRGGAAAARLAPAQRR